MLRFRSRSVPDLGDGPGPQLCWVKKEEMTEGKKASRQVNQEKKINSFTNYVYGNLALSELGFNDNAGLETGFGCNSSGHK